MKIERINDDFEMFGTESIGECLFLNTFRVKNTGKGIGTRLVTGMIDKVNESIFQTITIEGILPQQIYFYHKHGFRIYLADEGTQKLNACYNVDVPEIDDITLKGILGRAYYPTGNPEPCVRLSEQEVNDYDVDYLAEKLAKQFHVVTNMKEMSKPKIEQVGRIDFFKTKTPNQPTQSVDRSYGFTPNVREQEPVKYEQPIELKPNGELVDYGIYEDENGSPYLGEVPPQKYQEPVRYEEPVEDYDFNDPEVLANQKGYGGRRVSPYTDEELYGTSKVTSLENGRRKLGKFLKALTR